MPSYLEEDVRERAQKMKAFLMAIEAKDANAEEEYRSFKIKSAAATVASYEVRSMVRVPRTWLTDNPFNSMQ
jgi:hypothetical protein